MSTIPPSWKAEFDGGALHISGAVKYPNDFSTASLERVDSHVGSEVVTYRVVFHRDKEPYCDPDLVGPVHYHERNLPLGVRRIRVTVGTKFRLNDFDGCASARGETISVTIGIRELSPHSSKILIRL